MGTALITGASRGIGRAIALRLARDGNHVLINYRANHDEAHVTKNAIEERGGSAELCAFDICDTQATSAAMQELIKRHTIDKLVFCAGIHSDALLVFMEEKQWRDVLDTNLYSFYQVAKPVVKQMVLNRTGRIVVISSTSGESGLPGQVNYSAAKAGIIGAVKALALECAKRGVLVNAITPGFIATEMTEGVSKEEKARIPLGRFGTADEIAGVVSFLTSQDSSYVTGQVIRVNGGIYL